MEKQVLVIFSDFLKNIHIGKLIIAGNKPPSVI